MGGVGALLPPRLEQAQSMAALQELVEEKLFSAAPQETIPEFTQDRKVEPRIGQLKTQQILPVNPRADGLRRLAIGQGLAKLHDRH
jgi:hypothetical protein